MNVEQQFYNQNCIDRATGAYNHQVRSYLSVVNMGIYRIEKDGENKRTTEIIEETMIKLFKLTGVPKLNIDLIIEGK